MIRTTVILLSMLFLLASCSTGRDFHHRRYLPGRYVDKGNPGIVSSSTSARAGSAASAEKTAGTSPEEIVAAEKSAAQTPAVNPQKAAGGIQTRSLAREETKPAGKEQAHPRRTPLHTWKEKTMSRSTGKGVCGMGGLIYLLLVIGIVLAVILILEGYVSAGLALIGLIVLLIVLLALIFLLVIGSIIDESFRACNRGCR